MKRFLVSLCLLLACFGAFAQKSYIYVNAGYYYDTQFNIHLSGNLPAEIKTSYTHYQLAELLNMLSENGYNMDYCIGNGSSLHFIFSKGESGSSSAIQKVRADNDDNVTEIARYNLQGMPVNENEKGIQIIVYSNYTTKTLVVE